MKMLGVTDKHRVPLSMQNKLKIACMNEREAMATLIEALETEARDE